MLQYLIGSSDSKSGQEESEREQIVYEQQTLANTSVESVRHVIRKSDINTNE